MNDKQSENLLKGIAVIAGSLVIIAFCQMTQCTAAHSAEPITELSCPADTVSFTDAVDLIRKVDAVMAVKDTTWRHERIIGALEPNSYWEFIVIRSRRLVDVEVMSEPRREPTGTIIATLPTQVEMRTIPGTAVVFFDWEVE